MACFSRVATQRLSPTYDQVGHWKPEREEMLWNDRRLYIYILWVHMTGWFFIIRIGDIVTPKSIMLLIIATFVVESQRIILNGNLVESFLSSISVLTMRLLHYKAPPDLSVSGRFTNPGQVDVFLYQVFNDNVHSDLHPPPFTCPVRTAMAKQTRFFATIGTYLWNALHSSLCLTLMSGSRSASLFLLKTYFCSLGLRTGSTTEWSLLWAALYNFRNTIWYMYNTSSSRTFYCNWNEL